jgi:hypothetical protein
MVMPSRMLLIKPTEWLRLIKDSGMDGNAIKYTANKADRMVGWMVMQ